MQEKELLNYIEKDLEVGLAPIIPWVVGTTAGLTAYTIWRREHRRKKKKQAERHRKLQEIWKTITGQYYATIPALPTEIPEEKEEDKKPTLANVLPSLALLGAGGVLIYMFLRRREERK